MSIVFRPVTCSKMIYPVLIFNIPKMSFLRRMHLRQTLCVRAFVNGTIFSCTKYQHQRIQICKACTPDYNVKRGMKNEDSEENQLFKPVQHDINEEDTFGEEIVGQLCKKEISKLMEKFYIDSTVMELSEEHGIDRHLFQQTAASFRKFCSESQKLPTELHIILHDIIKGDSHIHELYPYFYKHARIVFPHLECIQELEKISDLTQPINWYPSARQMNRKIIFHAGPTNSGKTYHAMEQYLSSQSGVYCGPLKLLAVEIYNKANSRGVNCDLITGEEKKYVISEQEPSSHVSCTVEMASLTAQYDVAIIDEIQMIQDPQRGWAWTRALLGICANEIHLCGESSTIELIKEISLSMGEHVEVRRYKRLTTLTVEKEPLKDYKDVRPGDCIVCFSKSNVIKTAQLIEKNGHEVAVIYGGLPPGSKTAQSQKFNDPDHPCKILVATDAIGMGLNLSIRRIIFHTLIKPRLNDAGEKEMDRLSVSQALQISGRAGRFGTQFEEGYVTAFTDKDLQILTNLLRMTPPDVEQAGVHPTIEQLELFAYNLPNYTLSDLIDIFIRISSVDDSLYFLCRMDDIKFFARLIQHIPLQLKARYLFCCSPISRERPFLAAMFLKFARQFSVGEVLTADYLCRQVRWPLHFPKSMDQLVHLEDVFNVFELYLWLSYRFADKFPDADLVRGLQQSLDNIIFEGLCHITQLEKKVEGVCHITQLENKIEDDCHITQLEKKAKINTTTDTYKASLLKSVLHNIKDVNGLPKKSNVKNLPSKRKLKFSDRLINDGILSKRMFQMLKEELMKEMK